MTLFPYDLLRLPRLTSPLTGMCLSAIGLVITAGLLVFRPDLLGPHGPQVAPFLAMLFFVSFNAFLTQRTLEVMRIKMITLTLSIIRMERSGPSVHSNHQHAAVSQTRLGRLMDASERPDPPRVWDLTNELHDIEATSATR